LIEEGGLLARPSLFYCKCKCLFVLQTDCQWRWTWVQGWLQSRRQCQGRWLWWPLLVW